MLAQVPVDLQRVQRALGAPPGVGHHGHGLAVDGDHLPDARARQHAGRVIALDLAAEHRAGRDGGIQQAGQFQVGAIDQLAGGLFHRVQPRQALAGQLPDLRVLQHDVGRCAQLRGGRGHLAVAGAAATGAVRDHAVGGPALRCRHTPLGSGGLHQHHARGGAALAHVVLRLADAAAATGGEVAPDAVARQVLPRCRVLGADTGPVAFQLLGHQLRQAGQRALPHLGAGDADDDLVVGLHHHPGVDLGGATLRRRPGREAEHQRPRRNSAGAAQELTAREPGRVHACLRTMCTMSASATFCWPEATLMAARTRL